MSKIETYSIVIELPDEWRVFKNKAQVLAHGPDNTEVIGSSTVLTGKGTESERKDLFQMSKTRIKQLMRQNASDPMWAAADEMLEKDLASGINLIQLSSISTDGVTDFDQFMLAVGDELLFLTYEAPVSARKSRDLVRTAIECATLR